MCTLCNRRTTSFAIRVLSLSGRSFAHLSCDVTHWRVAQAIPHSLFSHFNFVFSLPSFDPHGIFRLQNSSRSHLSIELLFVFVSFSLVLLLRQDGLCLVIFLLLRPSFIHVALAELMIVQVVLVERTLVLGIVSDGQLLTFNCCFVLEPTLRR